MNLILFLLSVTLLASLEASKNVSIIFEDGQRKRGLARLNDAHQRSIGPCGCGRSMYGMSACGGIGSRIIGGNVARKNEFPWQAKIDVCFGKNCHICGGTLINFRYVLLAAHCVFRYGLVAKTANVKVQLGDHDRSVTWESPYYQKFGVTSILIHPDYNPNIVNNDVALIKLDRNAEFNKGVRPACLPETSGTNYNGRYATVAGWGYASEHGTLENTLLKTNLKILSNSAQECINGAQLGKAPPNTKLCAYNQNTDTCQGDSGGGLLANDHGRCTVIGVVSYGYGCGRKDFAGVYARVATYLPWIKATARNGGCFDDNSDDIKTCDLTCTNVGHLTRKYVKLNGIKSTCSRGICYALNLGVDLCANLNYPCIRLTCPINKRCDLHQVLSGTYGNPNAPPYTKEKIAGVDMICSSRTGMCCDLYHPHKWLCQTLNDILNAPGLFQ